MTMPVRAVRWVNAGCRRRRQRLASSHRCQRWQQPSVPFADLKLKIIETSWIPAGRFGCCASLWRRRHPGPPAGAACGRCCRRRRRCCPRRHLCGSSARPCHGRGCGCTNARRPPSRHRRRRHPGAPAGAARGQGARRARTHQAPGGAVCLPDRHRPGDCQEHPGGGGAERHPRTGAPRFLLWGELPALPVLPTPAFAWLAS